MNFGNIRVKTLDYVVTYKPKSKGWSSVKRKNHILGIQIRGSAYHNFGYQEFEMSEGCVYFLNQKDDFSVNVNEYGEALSVHFTTYGEVETDSFCIKIKNGDEIISLLENIQTNMLLNSNGDGMALSYFYRLCARFEEIRNKKYSKSDTRITAAKEYIDLHFKEKDCLANLEIICGLSRRRFNELFKKQLDITPNRYIVMRKVELAKQLLESDELSVSEISEICGFSDIYYFSKVFKSETGFTPREYRKGCFT